MSRGTIWRCLVEQGAEYEEGVDGKAYFDKTICLWKEYPNSISNRITTVIEQEPDSELWEQVLQKFESVYRFSARDKSDLAVNKFFPRDSTNRVYSQNAFEVSFYEEETLVRFYPIVLDEQQHPHFESPYSIGVRILSETRLQLQFLRPIDAPDGHFDFMQAVAFPSVFTWLRTIDLSKTSRKTNALIDKEAYLRTYRSIRETYGRPIVGEWTEASDPKKAVFEDCGIAAYINSLVAEDHLPKFKRYIDIGCGNGLLVHLLNKIGYTGYGVDVRQRKVWSSLFKDDDLRVQSVNPQHIVNDEPHFDPDVDLLIGNHSDELTPWIPVMAAKLKCDFFLIPCCPFNFFTRYSNNGSHLGPRRGGVSQYESFFEWTVSVAQRLGFHVEIDRLAIPSTKRLCIIGRVPDNGLAVNVEETIDVLTEGKQFVPRPQEIKNNNCVNIAKPDRERIARKLFDFLLNSSDETRDGWRCGSEVPLAKLAAILTDEDKALMKDQDGGLQTFMKNNFQIFHVYQASARLRDFRQPVVTSKKKPSWRNAIKKPVRNPTGCFMSANHPDGCPVGAAACRFTH